MWYLTLTPGSHLRSDQKGSGLSLHSCYPDTPCNPTLIGCEERSPAKQSRAGERGFRERQVTERGERWERDNDKLAVTVLEFDLNKLTNEMRYHQSCRAHHADQTQRTQGCPFLHPGPPQPVRSSINPWTNWLDFFERHGQKRNEYIIKEKNNRKLATKKKYGFFF